MATSMLKYWYDVPYDRRTRSILGLLESGIGPVRVIVWNPPLAVPKDPGATRSPAEIVDGVAPEKIISSSAAPGGSV